MLINDVNMLGWTAGEVDQAIEAQREHRGQKGNFQYPPADPSIDIRELRRRIINLEEKVSVLVDLMKVTCYAVTFVDQLTFVDHRTIRDKLNLLTK